MSTEKRRAGRRVRRPTVRALGVAVLWCAFAPSAPSRAQDADEERDFYLREVLKGRTGSVRCLLLDSKGTLWVGAQAGLFRLRDGMLVRAPGEDRAGMVNVLVEAQGSVWAGGEAGLFRVGSDGMSRVPGEETRLVHAIRESGGSLWLGARNGLFLVRDGAV